MVTKIQEPELKTLAFKIAAVGAATAITFGLMYYGVRKINKPQAMSPVKKSTCVATSLIDALKEQDLNDV